MVAFVIRMYRVVVTLRYVLHASEGQRWDVALYKLMIVLCWHRLKVLTMHLLERLTTVVGTLNSFVQSMHLLVGTVRV